MFDDDASKDKPLIVRDYAQEERRSGVVLRNERDDKQ